MKKFLAMLLAMMMVVFSFGAVAEAVNPDDIADDYTSEDGTYKLAFVTDVGQLKDFQPGHLERREGLRRCQWPELQVLPARQRRPGYR